jgi:integrase
MEVLIILGYIIQKASGYYFRFHIPSDLHPLVQKSELRYSLQTGQLALARSRARLLAGTMQQLIRKLRSGHMTDLTPKDINALIRKHIQRSLQADEDARIDAWGPFDEDYYDSHKEILKAGRELIRGRLVSRDRSFIEPTVDAMLAAEGVDLDKDSRAYRMLCQQMFKAEDHIMGTQQRRHIGDYSQDPSFQPQAAVNPMTEDTEPEPGKTISEIREQFFEEGRRQERWKSEVLIKDLRRMHQTLIDYFGDVPMNSLRRADLGEYRRDLWKIPKSMSIKPEYKGLDLRQVIALDVPRKKCLAEGTVDKYLRKAQGLFEYARINGWIPENPMEDMKVKKTKRAVDRRQIWSTSELEQIFGAPGYAKDKFTRSYMYWTPLLALFTGARQEEISNLRLKDFEWHEGIWCLNILADDGKDLKNLASRRLIPLHPFLIELGVIRRHDHLKAQDQDHFFPDLKPVQGRYGRYVSEWFNDRFKIKLGFPKHQGKDFHSFRHTFGTNLGHNDINDHDLSALMGHAESGMTYSTYVKPGTPYKLYKALEDHLDYGLNLDHLKGSKWELGYYKG